MVRPVACSRDRGVLSRGNGIDRVRGLQRKIARVRIETIVAGWIDGLDSGLDRRLGDGLGDGLDSGLGDGLGDNRNGRHVVSVLRDSNIVL